MSNSPQLAQYKTLDAYEPKYGDYIICAGWFSTWHGFVINYDSESGEVSIIFEGLPYLLLTMDEESQNKSIYKYSLRKIQHAPQGKWAVQRIEQSNSGQGVNVWYI